MSPTAAVEMAFTFRGGGDAHGSVRPWRVCPHSRKDYVPEDGGKESTSNEGTHALGRTDQRRSKVSRVKGLRGLLCGIDGC
jgi:hypothetical protein